MDGIKKMVGWMVDRWFGVDMWCQGNGWRDRCSGDELAIGGSGWGWVALVVAGLWPWVVNVEEIEKIEAHGALQTTETMEAR